MTAWGHAQKGGLRGLVHAQRGWNGWGLAAPQASLHVDARSAAFTHAGRQADCSCGPIENSMT